MVPSLRVILGIIGCAVCMLLYSAPILTFKRVIKEASVGEFSCIPYILTLFSCLTYSWYSSPVVSSGWKNLTVFLISLIGVLFEISFISIYLWFAPRGKKILLKHGYPKAATQHMLNRKKLVILIVSLFLAIFGVTILISSFVIHTHHMCKVFVGSIGVLSAMLMYSSPLVAVKQVIRTRSVEFMPFYLSLFSFLTSLIWMVYGLLGRDPYITSPNFVGCATGILQLVVYSIYSRSKERPKAQNNMENGMEIAASCKDATGHKP